MNLSDAEYLPFPRTVTQAEFERRRDRTTALELKKLINSKEFQRHCSRLPHSKSRGLFWLALLGILPTIVAVLLSAQPLAIRSVLDRPAIAPVRSAAGHAIGKILGRGFSRPLPQPQHSATSEQSAKANEGLEELRAALKKDQDKARALQAEREAATERVKALQATEKTLQVQSEIQQRALEKLNEEIGGLKATNSRLKGLLEEPKQQQQQQQQPPLQVLQPPLEQPEVPLDVEPEDLGDVPLPAGIAAASLGLLGLAAAFPLSVLVRRSRRQPKAAKKDDRQQQDAAAQTEAEAAREAADLEKLRGDNAHLRQRLDDLSKSLEEWQTNCTKTKEECEVLAETRGRLSHDKTRMEEEIGKLRDVIKQLVRASHQDAPMPPGLGRSDHIDGNAIYETPPGVIEAQMEDDDDLFGPRSTSGRNDWHGLSARVADMRAQLNKAKRKDSQTETGLSVSLPTSSLDNLQRAQDGSPRELQAENAWLNKQNSSLEAQLEQVTASLADLVDSKARADSQSLLQSQDLGEMAILLARKEDDARLLEVEVANLRDLGTRLLDWHTSGRPLPEDDVHDLRLALHEDGRHRGSPP